MLPIQCLAIAALTHRSICRLSSMKKLGLDQESLLKVVKTFAGEYVKTTTRKEKLMDAFLLYVFATGVLQFLYCALVGNFPFNSFLSGFISSVALFVLTVSLRLQLLHPAEFHGISPQRAVADYIICNVILHFVVMTFMG